MHRVIRPERRTAASVLAAAVLALALAPALALAAARAGAQPPAGGAPRPDTVVALTVRVRADSLALAAAVVRAGGAAGRTDARGEALLRLAPGAYTVLAVAVGFRPESLFVTLRAGGDTAVTLALAPRAAELEGVVVNAGRGERRVEDTPLRVEVVDDEEVAEKVAMTPGDVAMLLNETGGLRVQPTSPSLGGAGVRVRGLRGRHTLLLADGLPLYGGQPGGLGLLQIPPVDLARVEVIKGAASALYGGSALGGVVNFVARRPAGESERELLVNQTSRGGTDAVGFAAGPLAAGWGYTLLAGGHRQRRNDLDGDGWTDMPGYRRVVARPRLYWEGAAGRSAFLTAGYTAEDREGGTLGGRAAPDGRPYPEGLRTRRADAGAVARVPLGRTVVTLRGSAADQRHRHRYGDVRERDRHQTAFAEATLAAPGALRRGRVTPLVGAAVQRESYRAADVPGFDYTRTVPALFAQADADAASWLALSASARLDAHGAYGTAVNPRLSLLLRPPAGGRLAAGALAGWTARLSAGTGSVAPVPFTEETEVTGLAPLVPPRGLATERARGASVDVGGPLETPAGRLELNGTLFGSRVTRALQAVPAAPGPNGGALRLASAPVPTRTGGGELLARLTRAPLRVTATYTHLRGTEWDPDAPAAGARRPVPLNPRHALGVVASAEREGRGRLGVEFYYTGRQTLARDPYRAESRPYVLVGVLGERVVATPAGRARLFVNLENLGGVRQTRVDPLVRPARGEGGRWTTDVWSVLEGRTVNGGARLAF